MPAAATVDGKMTGTSLLRKMAHRAPPGAWRRSSARSPGTRTRSSVIRTNDKGEECDGEEGGGGVHRHVLAGPGWLRQRGARGCVPEPRDRVRRGRPGVRVDRPDDGVCHRSHLGLPPEPGGVGRPVGRGQVPGIRSAAVYRRPGRRGDRGGGRAVPHRERQSGLRRSPVVSHRTATERTRRAATRSSPASFARS